MKACLFDWNGTLLDDMLIWHKTMKTIFKCFGKEPPTIACFFEELERYHGDYLVIYQSRGVTLNKEQLNELYGKTYRSMDYLARLSPNARQTLQQLKARKIFLGLITSQPEILTAPLLHRFGLVEIFHYLKFDCVNKSSAILDVLAQENIAPKECCYVGDSPSDIRHANKAGVVSVAFINGHLAPEILIATNPNFVIRNFSELLKLTQN